MATAKVHLGMNDGNLQHDTGSARQRGVHVASTIRTSHTKRGLSRRRPSAKIRLRTLRALLRGNGRYQTTRWQHLFAEATLWETFSSSCVYADGRNDRGCS
jgi:hypothetical protein